MATKKHVLKGKKISNRHSAYIDEVEQIIVAAKDHDSVTRVVLSQIKNLGSGPRRLTHKRIKSGFSVKVRGSDSQQELFVYTTDTEAVWKALQDAWPY